MDEKKQKQKYFLIAGLGALVGGMIVAIVMGIIFLSNGGGSSSGSGQKVVVNDIDAATAVEAVAQAIPQSVVGVTATVTQQSMFGYSNGVSTGSGFIVTSDGYIVTNNHVVDGGKNIQISLDDKRTFDGELIWADSSLDVAVVKIKANDLPVVSLGDSSAVKIGQTAIAIGNPMGLEYARSVTAGIVSALNRSLVVDQSMVAEDLIQTDATINAGNSGGPLCNANGEVIGINTYKNYEAEGMGFALPINVVKPIVAKIVATGKFNIVGIGISGYDAQQAQYYRNAKNITKGVYVSESGEGAADAGIRSGDVITAIDGVEVNSMLEMKAILYTHEPGEKVNVTYERNGSSQSVDVTLSNLSNK